MALTQDDFQVFTVRPQVNTRDQDTNSKTYGQRINVDYTDEQWDVAKADAQYRIDNQVSIQEQNIRAERDGLLQVTDWAMVSDSPLSAEEKESLINWRQELRDITDYEGDVYDVVIPICPIASLPNTNYPNEPVENT